MVVEKLGVDKIIVLMTRWWEGREASRYCFEGRMIRFKYGPASAEFDQHVSECGDCAAALENERVEIKQ